MANTTVNTPEIVRDELWSKRIQDELQEALMAQGIMEWITDFPK